MSLTVRKAEREDSDRIAKLAMNLVEQHVAYDPVRFARIATIDGMAGFYGSQMDSDQATVLVAEDAGTLVGFAYVGYEERSYEDLLVRAAWLHDIYVMEDWRASGVGSALINTAREFAKRVGASKLMLSVASKNIAARGFFEQAGFKTTMHEMMLAVDDGTDG